MLVVLDEAVEKTLFHLVKASDTAEATVLLELDARLNADERLIVASLRGEGAASAARISGATIACHGLKVSLDRGPSYPSGLAAPESGHLLVLAVADQTPSPSMGAYLFSPESDAPQECEIEVVRLETDVFSRLKGIFDTSVMASKSVAVIGVGSGGSVGAVELAKAGIGGFILVDPDRLRAHNVSRHVCGLADVGRFKTRAVGDAIRQHSPRASVSTYEADITQDNELLHQIVSDSDLVFVATDTELSRYMINEACLELGKPAVYGGVYERAFAGEVLRVIPGEAGCYACVRQGMANTMRSISSQQVFDYTDDSDFQAEPGLGLDISMIAMIHAKVALMTLLRGAGSSLGDIDAQMIIWTNWARPQDGVLFERPLSRYTVRVPRSKDCPACGDISMLEPDASEGAP